MYFEQRSGTKINIINSGRDTGGAGGAEAPPLFRLGGPGPPQFAMNLFSGVTGGGLSSCICIACMTD